MFQTFKTTSSPEQGPPRLKALRAQMAAHGLSGFIVPRADAHQGEYVAPRDERLAWLTGFTGSAGFCIALTNQAGIFVDGRYRTQVKHQVDLDHFTPVPWPDEKPGPWLRAALPEGGEVGFDPWLYTPGQLEALKKGLAGSGITLRSTQNLVDAIWDDQPGRPVGKVRAFPKEIAGKGDKTKRAEIAETLREAGQRAVILTLPDCISWLLNIRGSDISRNPVVQAFAILHDGGEIDLFSDPVKFADLGPDPAITLHEWEAFESALISLTGPVRVDKSSAPVAVVQCLEDAGVTIAYGDDPCLLPKARKTQAEITSTAEAHLRDGAAVVELLAWLDAQAPGSLAETQVVTQLEGYRRRDNALQDISFETIAGTGPHGAIMHYRVTEETDATLEDGHLLVLDSGGQYLDGTTDITRTIAIGTPPEEARVAFTRVLQGMIAVSRLRWPKGLAGRDIEAIGRMPLWLAGQDFDHGLGHGVGVYLSVHEGPQRLSKISHVPLEPGMILSNEPGYYREGAFGIRIENLVVVQEAEALPGGDAHRQMLNWLTLTFAPMDRRLIVAHMLTEAERNWMDEYHADVLRLIGPRVTAETMEWLQAACAPL